MKTGKERISRRRFVAGAAAGGAGLLILRNSASAASYQANEKLNIALVGVGSADAKLGLTGVIGLVTKAKMCFAMSGTENINGNEARRMSMEPSQGPRS